MALRDVLGWAVMSKFEHKQHDDWSDRLSHVYTVVMLVVFALFVAGGTTIQDPISCWAPSTMAAPHVKYANNYCWIQNTYYLPMLEEIHRDQQDHIDREITYYQYVPFILLLMAFLFKIPNLIWRGFSGYSGISLHKIVELTSQAQYDEQSKREEKVRDIAVYIDRWLESNKQYHWNVMVRLRQKASRMCLFLNRREGTYLIGLYLLVKILFCVNAVGQFFLLDAFLGGFFSMWGSEAVKTLAFEHRSKESFRFPRVTMCDFIIRQMQNTHMWTVQCVLPLNLFNEKIFLFLWYWLIWLSVVTCGSLLLWLFRAIFRRNRVVTVKKYLKISSRLKTELDKRICKKFASFLRDDGIFLLRMVGKNSNDILVTDLVSQLWDIYIEKPMVKKMLPVEEGNDDIPSSRF